MSGSSTKWWLPKRDCAKRSSASAVTRKSCSPASMADPVGFALFFHNYSTFLGKPGIYLEDLFVRPEARGRGIGKRLLTWLARTTVDRDCGRLEWSVLDWNEPSIGFYRSLGAVLKDEWQIFRLTGRRAYGAGERRARPLVDDGRDPCLHLRSPSTPWCRNFRSPGWRGRRRYRRGARRSCRHAGKAACAGRRRRKAGWPLRPAIAR